MLPVPVSPYGAQKLVNELYAHQFALHFGITVVCLRYFNIFGPRQDPNSAYAAVLPCFLSRIRQGLPPMIHGDGSQTRDFTYVENAVEANLLALRSDAVGDGVFNVASGKQASVKELAEAVVRFTGWEGGIEYGPPRPGDVQHSYADITKAGILLGYAPHVSFEEGLQRTLEWYAQLPA
jgi:UDP-glucose 4-epimerase